MERKLYRSQTDMRLGGVCGGLGEYLNVDPTVIRLVFILLALTGGHGILLYIILWLLMPFKPAQTLSTEPPNAATNTHQ